MLCSRVNVRYVGPTRYQGPVQAQWTLVKPENRIPTQQRGFERYTSILDAYSSLISHTGDIQVTMQAVAHAAGASIGSLYHFFEGRDAMLEALTQRHIDRIGTVLSSLQSIEDCAWQHYTPTVAIETLMGALFDYISQHRDVYIVAKHFPCRAEFSEDGIAGSITQLYEKVLRLRYPTMTEDNVAFHAEVLYKLPTGLIEAFNLKPNPRLLQEAKIALAAYLGQITA
nr:TetR/AcrR family transcriptional regulator [Pseudomonas quercus]